MYCNEMPIYARESLWQWAARAEANATKTPTVIFARMRDVGELPSV